MFGKIEGFRFKICCTISRFRIKISADGTAQRRGGSANGKSARTIKKSFLKIYTFDAAKTVRIVLAIQSHPVFGPGHQLIKKWLDLKIWGKASRFWNDSADEANAEVSRCSAKFKGSGLRFVVQLKGSELKYQQMERPKDGVALGTGEVLKQLGNHVLHGRC